MKERFAVVAGGGTAGHVMPVLSVARALAEHGHPVESIEIVGARRGQEGQVLEGTEFPFTLLPGRGLQRSMSPRAVVANVKSLVDVARAAGQAWRLLRSWRPAVVVTVGGYASFAAGFAAVALRIPVVLVNTDAVPGLVHRLLRRSAAASAVAFPGTPLPRAVVTGSPVRPEIANLRRDRLRRAQARRTLGVPEDRLLVAAFGGSLGARRINEAVAGLVQGWSDRRDLAVYHVVGRRQWEEPGDGRPQPRSGSAGLWYQAVVYEDRMPDVYAAADLVVCRAGAMTVGELALTGTPAVLVPLPGAPDDHQTENALVLVRVGAARLLPDAQCSAETLRTVVEGLLNDPDELAAMSRGATDLNRPDAAERIAEVVLGNARRSEDRRGGAR